MARAAAARVAAPARTRPVRTRPAPARRPAPPTRRGAPARRPAALPTVSSLPARAFGLLYGRGLIAVVFVLLVGVVFANVSLLEMNRDIARQSEHAAAIKRENSRLRAEVARLGSSERVQRVAAEQGLVLPAPNEVRYLRSNPAVDAKHAAQRIDAGAVAATSDPTVVAATPTTVAPTTVVPTTVAPTTTATTVPTTSTLGDQTTAIAGTTPSVP